MEEYTSENLEALSPSQHIKLRPQLYFHKCFEEKLLDSLPLEVACHAIDEHIDGKCTQLLITVFEDHFSIQYNAGMSLEESFGETYAEMIMTKIGACSNHKKHLSVGEEFCELGIAVINYAAEYCEVTTISKGKKGVFTFTNGKLKSKNLTDSQDYESTIISLKPDPLIFKGLSFTKTGVSRKATQLKKKLAHLQIVIK